MNVGKIRYYDSGSKEREAVVNTEALFFTVVNRGKANAVLNKAREYGAAGGMIFYGEGTVQSKLMQRLGLTETQKEILMISAPSELCDKLHEKLSKAFRFHRWNKGIAFTIPFIRYRTQSQDLKQSEPQDDSDISHYCIMTIVDKGRSRECIKAARAAGARGGTLFHGTGAGVPADFYYPLVIEPQKDIVMIITTKEKVAPIRESITSQMELDKPWNGMIFTLPVSRASGLYENRSEERTRGVIL